MTFRYLLAMLCLPFLGAAQMLEHTRLEPSIHYGRIVKHTDKFEPNIRGNAIGFELNLSRQPTLHQTWQNQYGFPRMGLALSILDLGDKEIFGQSVGILPHFTFHFLEKKRLYGHFRIGAGIGFLTKKYNILTNPTNNAIGSTLNGMMGLRFGMGYFLSKKWTINTALALTHFSNGASTLPNLGLNIPSLNIGVIYTPKPVDTSIFLQKKEVQETPRQFVFSLVQGIAFSETITPNGPKYATNLTAAWVGRHLRPTNRLWAGFAYEFNGAVYQFMEHIDRFETCGERRRNASRLTFSLADEVVFGNAAMWFELGAYLSRSYLQPKPIFVKLGVRYYLPVFRQSASQVHLGVYLKSHQAIAEYLAFAVGVNIHGK